MICSVLVDARLLCPWASPGKNIGVGSMLSYRGPSRPRDQTCIAYVCLLHWQAGSLPLVPPGKLHSYHSSCISKLSSLCFIFRWPQPVWPDNKHSFPRLYPIPEAYQRHRKATGGEFCQGPGTKGRSTCIMPSQLIQISSTPRSVLQNNHYQVKQIHFTYICYQN